jgi:hypothetical protein
MNIGVSTGVPADFQVVVLLVVVLNGLWYRAKTLLRKNGYEAHAFYGHFGDVANMVRLISATDERTLRVRYIALLVTMLAGAALFVFLGVRLITGLGAA